MTNNNRKILITGANGFIGKHLLSELLPKNKIIGISLTHDKKTKNYFPLKKNILNLSDKDLQGNIKSIIHLAALTDVENCNKNPSRCFFTNVIGTQKILDIARKKDSKLVYVSTSHVYGIPQQLPISEEHPKNPLSIYASSKLAAENCCEGYSRTYGMDISIVRLFSVYGPNSPNHLVTSRIISQIKKKSVELGNLKAKRDFVYIDDVIKAILLVLKKSRGFNDYNVGTGKSYSIYHVYSILKKLSGANTSVKSVKSRLRKSDIPDMKANISKIKKLGWEPRISISNGLKMFYDGYFSNN